MKNLIISTEDSADIPKDLLKEYGIKVCPMQYFVDEKEYDTESNHMLASEFYGKMRAGADVKTTQVNYAKAVDFLKNLAETGNNVLHLSFSSGLSGTANNFAMAQKELQQTYVGKVAVVDSLCASAGQGLWVIEVAKKAKEDISFEELVKFAQDLRLKINHVFTVDDLKYLVKGGRVNKASAFFANVLHIKPLMYVDDDGKLAVLQKVFGRKMTIKKMFDKMVANYDPYYADIMISQADCLKDAEYLSKMIEQHFGLKPTIVPLDYLIGCHSGPGTLALFYVGDKRK